MYSSFERLLVFHSRITYSKFASQTCVIGWLLILLTTTLPSERRGPFGHSLGTSSEPRNRARKNHPAVRFWSEKLPYEVGSEARDALRGLSKRARRVYLASCFTELPGLSYSSRGGKLPKKKKIEIDGTRQTASMVRGGQRDGGAMIQPYMIIS